MLSDAKDMIDLRLAGSNGLRAIAGGIGSFCCRAEGGGSGEDCLDWYAGGGECGVLWLWEGLSWIVEIGGEERGLVVERLGDVVPDLVLEDLLESDECFRPDFGRTHPSGVANPSGVAATDSSGALLDRV